MMDTGIAIRTSEQVVAQVGKLKNHAASQAVMAKGSFATPTLIGIRKYFKFSAHKNNDWIYAFSDSIQMIHERRYQPRDVMAMSDIKLDRINKEMLEKYMF